MIRNDSWSLIWRMFSRNRLSLAGLCAVGGLGVVAIGADSLAPWDPYAIRLEERLHPPAADHWLGQDAFGRDVFSRILYGARVSLAVSLTAVTVAAALGTLIGLVAGYCGGWVDELIMRIIDVFLAFPTMLLAIAIMAIMGPGIRNVILALVITGWKTYARLVRGQVLVEREKEYVTAARALGLSSARIMLRHILPNVLMPVVIAATVGLAGIIMQEAGLSFLGLGAQPPTASWGGMLTEGRQHILTAWHLTTFPGLAIMAAVLAFNFLGDGLRDALDPRLRY